MTSSVQNFTPSGLLLIKLTQSLDYRHRDGYCPIRASGVAHTGPEHVWRETVVFEQGNFAQADFLRPARVGSVGGTEPTTRRVVTHKERQ